MIVAVDRRNVRLLVAVRRWRLPGVAIVRVEGAERGVASSLRAALRAVRPIERELLVMLGDMPFARGSIRWKLRAGVDAVRPMLGLRPGHPLLVRAAAARAAPLAGDRGLIQLLDRDRVVAVRASAGQLIDIDSPCALHRARRGATRHRAR